MISDFTRYNHDMDKAVIKNLKKKLHDFKHRLEFVSNIVMEETEKDFRIFMGNLENDNRNSKIS